MHFAITTVEQLRKIISHRWNSFYAKWFLRILQVRVLALGFILQFYAHFFCEQMLENIGTHFRQQEELIKDIFSQGCYSWSNETECCWPNFNSKVENRKSAFLIGIIRTDEVENFGFKTGFDQLFLHIIIFLHFSCLYYIIIQT